MSEKRTVYFLARHTCYFLQRQDLQRPRDRREFWGRGMETGTQLVFLIRRLLRRAIFAP
jgi:hypothetical protein